MTIGLFGGSFNPPHLAHLVVAESARDRAGLEEVWWIPARTPPHKRGAESEDLVGPSHRLAMTRRAVSDNPAFSVREIELRRSGPSYTVETLRQLQEEQPHERFVLVIGSDSLAGLRDWHRPDEIVERVELIVYPRPGVDLSDVPDRYREAATFVRTPPLAISGTRIRDWCRAGRSVRYLVPERVRTYMHEEGLYGL